MVTTESAFHNYSFDVTNKTRTSQDDPMHVIRMLSEVWLSMPIAVIGICLNVISFVVLCRHHPKMAMSLVLQTLAVADTAVLLSTLLLRSFRYVGIPGYSAIFGYLFCTFYPTTYAVRLGETWLIVLLTVERYIAVCMPLHATRLCSRTRTKAIIFVIVGGAFVLCIPRFFECTISKTDPDGYKATELMGNPYYTIIYRIILFFVVMYLIPMTALIVLNIGLLSALRESNKYRTTVMRVHHSTHEASTLTSPSSANDSKSLTRHVTAMAVTVVLVSIVCNVFTMLSHLLWSLHVCFESLKYLEAYRRYIANFSNVLVTSSCAINFFVYCAFSRQFRATLYKTIGCQSSGGCCCCLTELTSDSVTVNLSSIRSAARRFGDGHTSSFYDSSATYRDKNISI